MSKLLRTALVMIFCVNIGTLEYAAAAAPDLKTNIRINYEKLKSPDFNDRDAATLFFIGLTKEARTDEVVKVVADLLKRESENRAEMMHRPPKKGELSTEQEYLNNDEYQMHHNRMCLIVGQSAKIEYLPLLMQYGCLMPDIIINYKDFAVDPLIDSLKPNMNLVRRDNVIRILADMLKPKKTGYVASGEVRGKITKVLSKETSNSDDNLRWMAVTALGDSEDEDVIPVLNKIAKNDPYKMSREDEKGNMKDVFPVREKAQEAIKKIKDKKKEK